MIIDWWVWIGVLFGLPITAVGCVVYQIAFLEMPEIEEQTCNQREE